MSSTNRNRLLLFYLLLVSRTSLNLFKHQKVSLVVVHNRIAGVVVGLFVVRCRLDKGKGTAS